MLDIFTLLIITAGYLTFVYIVALAADKKWIPKVLIQHPLIYTLSLGGYIGTWAIFGAMELANSGGYTFLSYYIGTSALFIFSPLLLQPLLNLSRTYRLSSLADLFSFRYSSKMAGLLISLGTLICVLPLMALQIQTISESVNFLTSMNNQHSSFIKDLTPILFCLFITLFSLRFGASHNRNHLRHDGLIVATAFQALIKLCIFLGIGIIAIYTIFGSPKELELWLSIHPAKLHELQNSLHTNNSRSLMLIFFAAALSFPHMFHLAITENRDTKSLKFASWAFPVYLVLLSLPILPILWAVDASGAKYPAYFLVLAMGDIISSPMVTISAYICGLAAASSSMIVIIISVASMSINHFVLPYYSPQKKHNLYNWLSTTKSLLMLSLILISYAGYAVIKHLNVFNAFSFASYTVAFQFLPGILATFYWPKGNRTGLIAGLCAGFACWFIVIFLPMLSPNALGLQPILEHLFNLNGDSYWVVAAIACFGFNMLTFGIISLVSNTDEEQKYIAELCSQDNISKPTLYQLSLSTVEEFIAELGKVIGRETAEREISQALNDLNMRNDENRPFALRLLRRQIESNLSGLFGPTVARQLVTQNIPYQPSVDTHNAKDIQLIEHRLENFTSQFSGLAAELDSLRRYHRNTIEHLPIGVCTLNSDNEITMWNQAMAALTNIESATALGTSISSIMAPWNALFIDFINSSEAEWHNRAIIIADKTRWFTLHKARSEEVTFDEQQHTFLIEEVTALVKLEQDLVHNERLASIGRLAAGVAHEIGNPITGIACLAQNLKFDSDKPEIIDAAKDILTQTHRITRIVQSLINFSHAGIHKKQFDYGAVNLHTCAEDAIHLLSLDQRKITNNIHNFIDEKHIVNGDAQQLLQVFLNLIKNALDACSDNAKILIASKLRNNMVELTITDNGSGIPATLKDQIFEPFFTTKEPGEGTGLGLSVVYSIIEEHHGHIEVLSPTDRENNCGTCFIIQLPCSFGVDNS